MNGFKKSFNLVGVIFEHYLNWHAHVAGLAVSAAKRFGFLTEVQNIFLLLISTFCVFPKYDLILCIVLTYGALNLQRYTSSIQFREMYWNLLMTKYFPFNFFSLLISLIPPLETSKGQHEDPSICTHCPAAEASQICLSFVHIVSSQWNPLPSKLQNFTSCLRLTNLRPERYNV